jgi:cytidine deaminase
MNFKRLENIAFDLMPKHKNNMRCFHVSGIFNKKKLISVGFNKDITHPKTKKFNYHTHAKIHAELSACIKGGLEDYSGHTIAILRINANNNLDLSCPCAGCRDLIRQLGFSKVYHTTENGDWVNIDISDESKFPQNRP